MTDLKRQKLELSKIENTAPIRKIAKSSSAAAVTKSVKERARLEALMSEEACKAREHRKLLNDLPKLFDQVWTHLNMRKMSSVPIKALAKELSERNPLQKLHPTMAEAGLRLLAELSPEFCTVSLPQQGGDGESATERFTLKLIPLGINKSKDVAVILAGSTRVKDIRAAVVGRSKERLDVFVADEKNQAYWMDEDAILSQ